MSKTKRNGCCFCFCYRGGIIIDRSLSHLEDKGSRDQSHSVKDTKPTSVNSPKVLTQRNSQTGYDSYIVYRVVVYVIDTVKVPERKSCRRERMHTERTGKTHKRARAYACTQNISRSVEPSQGIYSERNYDYTLVDHLFIAFELPLDENKRDRLGAFSVVVGKP